MSENRYSYRNRNAGKGHPILTILLSAAISLFCGLGGGWFAYTHLDRQNGGGSAVVHESDSQGTSEITSVSSSDTGAGLTITEVAQKAAPSVVEIVITATTQGYGFFGGTYTSTAAGSGVIITEDGYIITNNHVVSGAETITVTTYDGKTYEAQLIGTDSKTDVAVIKIDAKNLKAAVIGDSSKISAGDTALVIGNPLGTLGGSVTSGIISAPSRELVLNGEAMELIQTDATINSGNSGGGLFDGNGNLIGIVNAKDSGTTSSGAVIEGIGFAIPVNTAKSVAEELIQYGEVRDRATIGIYLQTLTQDTQDYKAGVYITGLIKGGGAEAAGLQAYDRILSVDGQEITAYTDISRILRDKDPGDTIEMEIDRAGEQMKFTVKLTGSLNKDQS